MTIHEFCNVQDPFEDESVFVPSRVSGVFWISECIQRRKRDGSGYIELKLDQGNITWDGVIWPERSYLDAYLPYQGALFVQGIGRNTRFPRSLVIRSLRPLTLQDTVLASKVLPDRLCAPRAIKALEELRTLETSLTPPFQAFIRSVLLDSRIGIPFLNCRASVNDHHPFRGGLLVHTMQGMNTLLTACRDFHGNDPTLRDLAVCALLLHDLGKMLSVGTWVRPHLNYPKGKHPLHEQHTLTLLEPHWDVLYWGQPHATERLKKMMAWMAIPYLERRFPPEDRLLEMVIRIDGWGRNSIENS